MNLFKSILILSGVCFLCSCEGTKGEIRSESNLILDTASISHNQRYKIYTLEGCEYIVAGAGDSKWGAHKGNCSNPIHGGSKIP